MLRGSSCRRRVYIRHIVCTRWYSQPSARYNHRRTTVTPSRLRIFDDRVFIFANDRSADRSSLVSRPSFLGRIVPPRNPANASGESPMIAPPTAPPSRGDYSRPTLEELRLRTCYTIACGTRQSYIYRIIKFRIGDYGVLVRIREKADNYIAIARVCNRRAAIQLHLGSRNHVILIKSYRGLYFRGVGGKEEPSVSLESMKFTSSWETQRILIKKKGIPITGHRMHSVRLIRR